MVGVANMHVFKGRGLKARSVIYSKIQRQHMVISRVCILADRFQGWTLFFTTNWPTYLFPL